MLSACQCKLTQSKRGSMPLARIQPTPERCHGLAAALLLLSLSSSSSLAPAPVVVWRSPDQRRGLSVALAAGQVSCQPRRVDTRREAMHDGRNLGRIHCVGWAQLLLGVGAAGAARWRGSGFAVQAPELARRCGWCSRGGHVECLGCKTLVKNGHCSRGDKVALNTVRRMHTSV